MKEKNIMVLCFIFVLIGSLSFVSAGESNATAVGEALGDGTLSMENNVWVNETSTLLQNNENTLKVSENAFGSFTELNETIYSADSIITLNKDYIFNSDTDFDLREGIVISKDLTINGNNHYIDADYNQIRIFTTASNVVLNNITFKNSGFTEEGSAILAHSSININNCTFDDNGPGSAVSLKADNSYITNSKFTDNNGHAVTVDSKNNHIRYSYFKNNGGYDVFISDDQSAYLNYNVFLDSNPFNQISPQYFRSNWYGSNKPLQSDLNYLNASLDYNLEDNVLTVGIIFSESDTGSVIDVPWSRVVAYTVDFKTIIGDTLNPVSFSNVNEGFVINAFIDGQRLTNYDGRIWYVNSSVSSSGSGTQDSPFKIIKNAFDAANDGDTIYIAPGVYKEWNDLDLIIPKSLTVDRWGDDGEVILDSPGWRKFFTINSNVILSSLIFRNGNSVYNGGSIIVNAESVIFNCLFVNSSTNEYGGVIDMKSDGTIINCKFINNTSPRGGGAIYTAGINLNIINSIFEDNSALYGAAVYGESSQSNIQIVESVFKNNTGKIGAVRLDGNGDVYDSTFIDNYATLGGAAVAIFDKNHTISNSKFTGNYAGNGGAVLSTKANLTVKNSHFTNNDATTFGGALFNNYGNVSIYESSFKDGNAYYDGGAVYLNQGTNVIYETFFSRNIAGYGGGAIHSLASNLTCARLSMPGNITADINGYVSAEFLNSFIDLGNYTMIVANTSNFNGTIPSYFNLADHGWTTAIRDQGSLPVCWDFATVAMVETAVKKASGIELDLSEGNLKNLISVYSMYGENYNPNKGRGSYEGTLYFINSLGPVLESDDPTTFTGFSPLLLNDVIHVSNVAYASRTGFLDNDDVKKAVMKYGGVTATFCSSTPNYNIFHNGTGDNHHEAIIVGWDDNYSKDNFENCSQDGAWIIKNSWGPIGFNNTGYYFLSYYDTTTLFDYMLYVIFNDTIKYDRAYEYDWLCYHMADSGKDTTWYKNVFTSVKDEGITAFSTHFNKIVDWEASVYVNGELKHVQNGSSIGKGFFTYNFDKVIPVRKGDQFEIVVKVNSRNYPITDKHSFNKPCDEFCSYYSTDGVNWNDLYYVEGNSVAALKAYTRNLHDSHVEISSAPENATLPDLFTVTFNVENRTKVNYTVKNETDDIISEGNISGDTIDLEKLPAGNYTLTITNEDSFDYFGSSTSFKFRILKATPKITITSSNVTYPNSIAVNIVSDVSGRYDIKTGNKTQSVNLTENQIQSIEFKDLKPDIYTITVTYNETANYTNASKNTTAEVYKADSSVEIRSITNGVYGSLTPAIDVDVKNITALTYAILKNGIKIENGIYDDIGDALSKLGAGNYEVIVSNEENEIYNASNDTANFEIKKATPKITITAGNVVYPNDIIVNIACNVTGTYVLKVGNKTEQITLTAGMPKDIKFEGYKPNEYPVTLTYIETENYTQITENTHVKVYKANSNVKISSITNGVYNTVAPKIDVSFENKTELTYALSKNGINISTGYDLDDMLLNLNAGEYCLSITNRGNEIYNSSSDSAYFKIEKATPKITITADNVVYPNDIIVIIKSDVPGIYTIRTPDEKKEVTLTSDKSQTVSFGYLNSIVYKITAAYNETENYNGATETKLVKVSKADSSVKITNVVNGTYGATKPEIKVQSENQTELTYSLTKNTTLIRTETDLEKILSDLNAGEYSITVTNLGNINYNPSSDTINFKIEKATTKITIDPIGNVVYGSDDVINFNVTNITDLSYTITKENQPIKSENTHSTEIPLSGMDAGDYTIVIRNSENENYAASSATAKFTIQKAAPALTITVKNIVYPNNLIVNINANLNGTYYIKIGNRSEKIDLTADKTETVTFTNLAAGNYTITAHNYETENYKNTSASKKIKVYRYTPAADITALDAVYPNDITVTITSDVTGTYAIKVGDKTEQISLTAGMPKDIKFEGYKPNEYPVTLTYIETENYTQITENTHVRVYKANSNVKIISVSPGIYNTTSPTINVSITNRTDMTYTISKNGTEIKSGNYNELYNYLSTLSSGSYTIKITNEENDNYNHSKDTATFTISKASTKLTIYPIANVTYGNDTRIKFDVVNKTSVTYVITKDGKEIKRENTDNNEIILTKLDAGSYKITLINSENDNYKSDEKSADFTVNKISSPAVDNITEEIEFNYGDAIKIPIENKNAMASVINHPEAVITIENNTVIITNLDSGNYTINITFPGDENRENTTRLINISINKAKPAITQDNIKIEVVDQHIILNISSQNPIGVQYHVYDMQGKLIYNYTLDGSEKVTSPKLSAGEYSIVISIIGDSNHAGFTKEYSVTVNHEAKIADFKTKTSIYYMETNKISVHVVDENNKAISNYSVQFNVSGKIYNIITDINGYASVSPTLKPETHSISVTVANNTNTSKITVKHIIKAKKTTSIKKSKSKTYISISLTGQKIKLSKKVTFKYNGKKKINIKFGSAVKNQKISLKFKGTAYSIKVNKKGIGTLKLSSKAVKKLKKGKKYKATISYKGIKCYKNVKVKIKFNGKKYFVKTNKNGVAKFKVTKEMLKKFKKGKTVSYVISYKNDQLKRFIKIK